MIRRGPNHIRGGLWRRHIRWWIGVCVLLVAGCGDDEAEQPNAEHGIYIPEEEPEDPEELCELACRVVYADTADGGCQQVFHHDGGAAMNESGCVEHCLHEDLFREGQWCVITEAECTSHPDQMVDACLSDDYHAPACDHLGAWDSDWAATEHKVVELVNELRADGATCPSTGTEMPPVGPLQMDEVLRCAARLHSKDMDERNFFAHDNPDGEGPTQRIVDAGYTGTPGGENIAFGFATAEAVVNTWMTSDSGHCENMLNGQYTDIGVGRYETYWTQKFGR